MTAVAGDHEACAAVLRRAGSSFALPIRLLPAAKRRGTTALYAFCRRADDIVDDSPDVVAAERALADFEQEVEAALRGGESADPVVRALADTARRFAVPEACLRDVIAGVRMDLRPSTYRTWSELEEYCRRVASAVGLAAIHIWGFMDSPAARAAAHQCGLAFQLTNILRDIREDLGRGRVYLPEEDFAAAGCTVDDLRTGARGEPFERLAAIQTARAARCFERAAPLDRFLSSDGRLAYRAMFGVYSRLFTAVRQAGVGIFRGRVPARRVPLLVAAATAVCLGPRRRFT